MKEPLSEKVFHFISHSWGFDFLDGGSLIFWTVALGVSLFFVV